eukprot:EG_transcript_2333
MWLRKTAYNFGLLRGFQFIDPELERQYREVAEQWTLVPAQCHALWTLFNTCLYLADFAGSGSLPPAFWAAAIVASTAGGMLVAYRTVHVVQANVIAAFSGYCTLMTIYLAWLLYAENSRWLGAVEDVAAPLVQLVGSEDKTWRAVHGQLMVFVLSGAINTHLLYGFAQIFFLVFSTFGAYSFGSLCCMPVAFLASVACTNEMTVQSNCLLILRLIVICAMAILMSIFVTLMHRSSFLAQVLLARELKASQLADSVLNHGLKNTMADVAGNMELFLSGEVGPETLVTGMAALRRGIRSCRERLVYLKLVAGDYVPTLAAVSLKDFGEQLIAGRDVVGRFLDCSVRLDPILCNLIFDNAINHAFQTGAPQNRQVKFTVEEVGREGDGAGPLEPGHRRLAFAVLYAANPLSPMSEDFVHEVMSGQFPIEQADNYAALSDRIGIAHAVMAARQHGMAVSIVQDGGAICLCFLYDAPVAGEPPAVDQSGVEPGVAQQFPAGLRFYCIDDSPTARRLLAFHINKWMNPNTVVVMGEQESDVSDFVGYALAGADIVIIDQNLEYGSSYLGTDLVKQLLRCRFPGLICINSANTSPSDVELYYSSGAHCVFGKDLLGAIMMEQLKAAYLSFRSAPARMPPRQASGPHSSHVAWESQFAEC